MSGAGVDSSYGDSLGEFEVSGTLDLSGTGSWTWHRRFVSVEQTILYRGYSDVYGCYGVYTSKRADGSAASFMVSTSRQPRVYRLYRDNQRASQSGINY